MRPFPDLGEEVHELAAPDLKRRLDDGEQLTLLDTRRPGDFDHWQIDHPNLRVANVPFTAFIDEDGSPADEIPADVPREPLVTCCAKGISSYYVAQVLARHGWRVMALADGMEGWATLNESLPIDAGPSGTDALQFHRPSSGCLAYLLIAGEEAAVVDPLRVFSEEYAAAARERGATLEYAIDTHVHADHVSGVRDLAESTAATPVLPAGAVDRGLAFDATLVEDGETLPLGDTEIEAAALPGHTTEMVGYRFGDLFLTGDTVFLDGVARPDLEDSDRAREAAGTLWETLGSLEALPDDIVVGPGHAGPATEAGSDGTFTATLGELRERLRAFGESREAFVDRALTELPPRPANFERIIAINLGTESADSDEAFELELGPNNCAVAE